MNRLKSLVVVSCFSLPLLAQIAQIRLINGQVVKPGMFDEVVQIRSLNALCSATLVGPRTLITAAHCAPTGAEAKFQLKGVEYTATMTRSALYPGQDHDLSIGIVNREVVGVTPASIGGQAKAGLGITLVGYGCTTPGGDANADGRLRYGETVVTEFSNFDMVSYRPNGAALCFGDSGGPAFVTDANGRRLLLGVNSKGNIRDTNYNSRTDLPQSRSFLQNIIDKEHVEICGINKECGAVTPNNPDNPTNPNNPSNPNNPTNPSNPNNPNIPNYAVVTTYCGDNTINETQVLRVCTGLVKYNETIKDLGIKEVVVVAFRDGTQEVLPVLVKSGSRFVAQDRKAEQWVIYGNNAYLKSDLITLDTRIFNVGFFSPPTGGSVPTMISGRSVKNGQAFNVESFKKMIP